MLIMYICKPMRCFFPQESSDRSETMLKNIQLILVLLIVESYSALGNGTAAYAFAADQWLGKTITREHMPAEAC